MAHFVIYIFKDKSEYAQLYNIYLSVDIIGIGGIALALLDATARAGHDPRRRHIEPVGVGSITAAVQLSTER